MSSKTEGQEEHMFLWDNSIKKGIKMLRQHSFQVWRAMIIWGDIQLVTMDIMARIGMRVPIILLEV